MSPSSETARAAWSDSTRSARGEFLFEMDSFEIVEGRRLELSGRWFGVRGRRFVRPTLTFVGANDRARLLADLEHKPWSAEDGEPWRAAFGRRTAPQARGARAGA